MASNRKITKAKRKARDLRMAKRRQQKTRTREKKMAEAGALILS